MGFPGLLVKGGMGGGFCLWRPQGLLGAGRPLQLGDDIYVRHRPGGCVPLRARGELSRWVR